MSRRKVDIAIIGAGTAGLTAYSAARKHTDNLVLIEGDAYGTTCARVGCMPSKLLIAAAQSAHDAAQAGMFGVHVGDIAVNGAAVLERVRRERDAFVGSVLAAVAAIPAAHKLFGCARFLRPGTLAVGDTLEIEAERIVIATGSGPTVPDMFRGLGDRLLTSDSAGRFPEVTPFVRQVPLSIVFTSPQIMAVGVGVGQLSSAESEAYAVGTASFEDQGRSKVIGENRGVLKVYAERESHRFVGAEMFGPAAEHIAHLLAWAAQNRMTVSAMLAIPLNKLPALCMNPATVLAGRVMWQRTIPTR